MKYLASTGCLLLHLTTFVSAAPPPEDLTHVSQPFNILTDDLLLNLDMSNQPVPCTLPFASNEQSQQPSSVGPTPFTSTHQPAQFKAKEQQNASRGKPESPYYRRKHSEKPEDQERYRKMLATRAQKRKERHQRLKASDKPEDQEYLLKLRAYNTQWKRDNLKRLEASDKPEDQKRLRDKKEGQALWRRESRKRLKASDILEDKATCQRNDDARKSKEGLAGLSTQKRTYIDYSNHVGTSNVHVPSLITHFGININNGLAQESQIQYDVERYTSEHAEWNAGLSDSNILERETESDRPLKRKKVNSNSLELCPITDKPTCIGHPSSADVSMHHAIENHDNAGVWQILDTYKGNPPIDFEPILASAVYNQNYDFLRHILQIEHLSSKFTCNLALKAADCLKDLEARKILDSFLRLTWTDTFAELPDL